ncbi:glycosyltransferase [Subtercola vilae]|uniref:D-inositol 3-phosphate glycosyltransferase n=1 Tax=Subtercola vilae TaxID=2056433 RepID=A0A4T2C7I7_9MICO|nr:glycosyltransferase [Subtercola vilae]TIH40177.1 glycosyltransferase [Subtercola vilae]
MSAAHLNIVVIAPLRYPITEPHAGGLESSIWHQVNQLRQRGHRVTLCAVEGSDFMQLSPPEFVMPPVVWAPGELPNDVDYPAGYLDTALPSLERALAFIAAHPGRFDLVHNHSLHGTPLAWAGRLGVPMVSTLHTPVLPGLVAGHALSDGPGSRFVAVSSHTSAEWMPAGIVSDVLPNAVDSELWPAGEGGSDLVWFGRIVVEKGAHLAIDAAQLLGRRIVLAGRVGDPEYFENEIRPRLGTEAVYVGELRQPELAALVGQSACALVTPVWQEPFGLIIAETLMTGTPVACFETGGVAEVVAGMRGAGLVPVGDVPSLAVVADELIGSELQRRGIRSLVRAEAIAKYSLAARVLELEELYEQLVMEWAAVGPVAAANATPLAKAQWAAAGTEFEAAIAERAL